MKALPDPTTDTPTLSQLAKLVASVDEHKERRWGKMTPAQMLKHCRVFCELCLGSVPTALPIRLLARAIGPWFLRRLLAKSPTETPKNLQTLKPLRAQPDDQLDLAVERERLLAALATIERLDGSHRHPLYGSMRAVDVQSLVRHHTTHHLHQFGMLV